MNGNSHHQLEDESQANIEASSDEEYAWPGEIGEKLAVLTNNFSDMRKSYRNLENLAEPQRQSARYLEACIEARGDPNSWVQACTEAGRKASAEIDAIKRQQAKKAKTKAARNSKSKSNSRAQGSEG